jgi:hypothetical protein
MSKRKEGGSWLKFFYEKAVGEPHGLFGFKQGGEKK